MSIEFCRIKLQSDYKNQQKKELRRDSGQFVHCPFFVLFSIPKPVEIMGVIFRSGFITEKWFGKFSPWCTTSGNPHYAVHHSTVIIFCRAPSFSFRWMFLWKHFCYSIPFAIFQLIPVPSHTSIISLFFFLCNINIYFLNKTWIHVNKYMQILDIYPLQ